MIFPYVWVMTIACRRLTVKVIGRGQRSTQNVYVTRVIIITTPYEYCLVAVLGPAATAESNACRRGNAIGFTSILNRRQFFSSSFISACSYIYCDLHCIPNRSDTKIRIYIHRTQLSRSSYHFNLTNYYLFKVNYTNLNKIQNIVFAI